MILELLSKGLARDITRRIQAKRKDLNLDIEATIELEVWMENAPELFESDQEWIISETRASKATFHPTGDSSIPNCDNFEVDGSRFRSLCHRELNNDAFKHELMFH